MRECHSCELCNMYVICKYIRLYSYISIEICVFFFAAICFFVWTEIMPFYLSHSLAIQIHLQCLSLAPVSQLMWTRKERDCMQSKVMEAHATKHGQPGPHPDIETAPSYPMSFLKTTLLSFSWLGVYFFSRNITVADPEVFGSSGELTLGPRGFFFLVHFFISGLNVKATIKRAKNKKRKQKNWHPG